MGADLGSPTPRLSVGAIAAAAIGIADREGIDAVSMRRVAGVLGAGTMSLYRHVANREAMLDAMLDALYRGIEVPTFTSPDWREDARWVARTQRALMRSHPWVASLAGGRPPVLPSFLRLLEFSLGTYERAGLGPGGMSQASTAMYALVVGFALLEAAESAAGTRSGLTKEAWRQANAPVVARLLNDESYPAVARFVRDSPDADPEAAFEDAMACLIDGLSGRAWAVPGT